MLSSSLWSPRKCGSIPSICDLLVWVRASLDRGDFWLNTLFTVGSMSRWVLRKFGSKRIDLLLQLRNAAVRLFLSLSSRFGNYTGSIGFGTSLAGLVGNGVGLAFDLESSASFACSAPLGVMSCVVVRCIITGLRSLRQVVVLWGASLEGLVVLRSSWRSRRVRGNWSLEVRAGRMRL
jgi:hypothetical protein